MKKTLFIAGLLSSSFSYGADWFLFSTSGKNTKEYTEHYYDKSSLKKTSKGVFSLWQRAYEVENKFRADMRIVVNCENRTTELKEVFYYHDNIFLNNKKYTDNVSTPPPDTIGYGIITILCN